MNQLCIVLSAAVATLGLAKGLVNTITVDFKEVTGSAGICIQLYV